VSNEPNSGLTNFCLGLLGFALFANSAAWVGLAVTGTHLAWSDALPSLVERPRLAPISVATVLFAAVLVLVGWLAVRLLRWNVARQPRSARYARNKELAPLVVTEEASAGRLVLGYCGHRLLAAEEHHSVAVIAPTGAGKTLSFVEGNVLGWPGPVIATSVKRDVLEHTRGHRASVGPVYVYDPTCSTGQVSATWTPLAWCRDWDGAVDMARWLTEAAALETDGKHSSFWSGLGRKLLAPLLYAGANDGKDMSTVLTWTETQSRQEPEAVLSRLGNQRALNSWTASWYRPDNTKGSVYATVETVLEAYADSKVLRSAESCELWPDDILQQNATVYLVAPTHAQEKLRPLFEAFIMSVVRCAENRAAIGQKLEPGLLLMLDEAGNVSPLRDLPQLAATVRDLGITLATVWQDEAQIKRRYGGSAATVLNNHRAMLALSGITDMATLDYLSRLMGETEVSRQSVTRQSGGMRSVSESTQDRKLAPLDDLRQLPVGHGLLIYGNLPPAKLRLRRADRGRLGGLYGKQYGLGNVDPFAPRVTA
jgi:type IV secretion system protein VirD4